MDQVADHESGDGRGQECEDHLGDAHQPTVRQLAQSPHDIGSSGAGENCTNESPDQRVR